MISPRLLGRFAGGPGTERLHSSRDCVAAESGAAAGRIRRLCLPIDREISSHAQQPDRAVVIEGLHQIEGGGGNRPRVTGGRSQRQAPGCGVEGLEPHLETHP